jgi:hypothetical protein
MQNNLFARMAAKKSDRKKTDAFSRDHCLALPIAQNEASALNWGKKAGDSRSVTPIIFPP